MNLVRMVALALLLGVSGCGQSAPSSTSKPATVADGLKLRNWVLNPPVVERERAATPLRLVCAAPSATEICCALGLREWIVGRTRFCDYPPGIEAVPAIGALDETNIETLLALKPDLLLIAGHSRAIADRLEPLHLRYESLPDVTLADIYASIARVGEVTAHVETARELAAGIQADVDRVARRFAHVPAARVLLTLHPLADPPSAPFVAGPGSFYDDLLHRVEQRNVAGDGAAAYAPFALETIVRADPEVIIELKADGAGGPAADEDALRRWSRVGDLAAVRSRRVYALVGQLYFIPGPRIAEVFADMCRCIAGGQP